jgi:hypothetical protein
MIIILSEGDRRPGFNRKHDFDVSFYKDQTIDLSCYYGFLYFAYYSSKTNCHFIRSFSLRIVYDFER